MPVVELMLWNGGAMSEDDCAGAAWLNWDDKMEFRQEACYFWILKLT